MRASIMAPLYYVLMTQIPIKTQIFFEANICHDIDTLKLNCDTITHASDYFDDIIKYAFILIRVGAAYVDNNNMDIISNQRATRTASDFRNSINTKTGIDSNINAFNEMLNGKSNSCLRVAIDYDSVNGCLRDPVIFRVKHTPHSKTANKYYAYPTYDFACPILDALQGVTHAMRSVEYRDRDPQYNWFLDKLNLRFGDVYPVIMDYGKLNFTHTALSKRKLAAFIASGLIPDWTDPRMPTIRGIIRAGICVQPVIQYIESQLTSKSIVQLTWQKLISFNNDYLDSRAPRIFGIPEHHLVVQLKGDIPTHVHIDNHPKHAHFGNRKCLVDNQILVDANDFKDIALYKKYTLIGLGNSIIVCLNPLTLYYVSCDTDYKHTSKITWIASNNYCQVAVNKYSNLLTVPKLQKTHEITDVFNKNSLITETWFFENKIADYNANTHLQIMRYGYCVVDTIADSICLNMICK